MRVISGLVFVAAAAVVSSVLAADKTWTGNLSTLWATSGNWSPSGAPSQNSPYEFAIIPGALTRYPVVSVTTQVSGLNMVAGSQLTLDGSTNGTKLVTVNTTKASALNGTIRVTGANAQLCLSTNGGEWTQGGTIVFASGGNMKPTADNYTAPRTLTNSGGTIQTDPDNPGTTILMPFTTINGGTLGGAWWARSTTGDALHGLAGSPHWLSLTNVTLGDNFSAASVASDTYPSTHIGPANLYLTNSVINNSTVFDFPSYGSMTLEVTSGNTFTFGGTGALGLQGKTLSGTGVSTIANNGAHTLSGYGIIGAANLTNAGTIKATGGTLATPRTLSATAISSTGRIVVDPYSTLSVSGTLLSDTGSTVAMGGGTISASTFTLNGALSGYGTIGNVANAGSIRATGGALGDMKILNTGTISGSGTVTVDQYNAISATGTVTASAVNVYGELHTDNSNWTVSTLNNTGIVHVETGKSLTSAGAVTGAAGSILMVNGTLEAPLVSMAGTIMGSGTVNSIVTLTGIVSPGNSPGTLTMDGLVVGSGAQYNFETGDLLIVNGALEFLPGAAMTIHVPAGLPTGVYYPFVTFGSIVNPPSFIVDGVGYVSQEGSSFGFQVPEPAVLGMAGVICLVTLVRRPVKKAEVFSGEFHA